MNLEVPNRKPNIGCLTKGDEMIEFKMK